MADEPLSTPEAPAPETTPSPAAPATAAPETPATSSAPTPLERTRQRLGLDPAAPKAAAPATAPAPPSARPAPSDYEKANAAYRARQQARVERQRNEDLLRRLEERLKPPAAPATPGEVPDPEREPARWLEHALDQRLKPIVEAFGTVREQEAARAQEEAEIRRFQEWQQGKAQELHELTADYQATPTGAACIDRFNQWRYLKAQILVHAGHTPEQAERLVNDTVLGLLGAAESNGLNPVVYSDRFMSSELRSWGYTEQQLLAGGMPGDGGGKAAKKEKPAPPAPPAEIAQLRAAAAAPVAGGIGTPRGGSNGTDVDAFVNAGADLAAMKRVVGQGANWKNNLRRLQREARARAGA